MRVTHIRLKNGKKPDKEQVKVLSLHIQNRMKKLGFNVFFYVHEARKVRHIYDENNLRDIALRIQREARAKTRAPQAPTYSLATKWVGMHFGINESIHGWNAYPSRNETCGYTRTNAPSRKQQVAFYSELNNILDAQGITCRVSLYGMCVRSEKEGRYSFGSNDFYYHYKPEAIVRKEIGASDIEERSKIRRAKEAKVRRDMWKTFKNAKSISVVSAYNGVESKTYTYDEWKKEYSKVYGRWSKANFIERSTPTPVCTDANNAKPVTDASDVESKSNE